MKLLLIRHGETVDNVAGLYAGVRDSALTVHGAEQARRLGEHVVKKEATLTHVFASPLSRAFKTAEALRKAQQSQPDASDGQASKSLEIVKVPDLIEQDFGFYEGKPFYARTEAKKSGRDAHYEKHKDEPGFVDVESKESMCKRADAFLDEHLLPLLGKGGGEAGLVVAIVSHGMLLAALWRRLLLRLPRRSLTIAPEVTAAKGSVVLEHLGGWSNTGYLELSITCDSVENIPDTIRTLQPLEPKESVPTLSTSVPPPVETEKTQASLDEHTVNTEAVTNSPIAIQRTLKGWSTTILAVDSKQHLVGLKRQRGGIGRIAHDANQKKLDGFFKRQKTS